MVKAGDRPMMTSCCLRALHPVGRLWRRLLAMAVWEFIAAAPAAGDRPRLALAQQSRRRRVDTLLVRILFPTAAVGLALVAEERAGAFSMRSRFRRGIASWLRSSSSTWPSTSSMCCSTRCRCSGGCTACTTPTSNSTSPPACAFTRSRSCCRCYQARGVAALGAPALAVLIFEVLLNATSMFNHGNVRMPRGSTAFCAGRGHARDAPRPPLDPSRARPTAISASTCPGGTACSAPIGRSRQAGHEGMTIGIEQFRDPRELRLDRMLLQPFRRGPAAIRSATGRTRNPQAYPDARQPSLESSRGSRSNLRRSCCVPTTGSKGGMRSRYCLMSARRKWSRIISYRGEENDRVFGDEAYLSRLQCQHADRSGGGGGHAAFSRGCYGNPSSGHWAASRQRWRSKGRADRSPRFSAHVDEVVFTSGGSEGEQPGDQRRILPRPGKSATTSSPLRGAPGHFRPVPFPGTPGRAGDLWPGRRHWRVDPERLAPRRHAADHPVSVMHATTRSGRSSRLQGLRASPARHGVLFHTDAAQSVGKIPSNVDETWRRSAFRSPAIRPTPPRASVRCSCGAACGSSRSFTAPSTKRAARRNRKCAAWAVALGSACELARAWRPCTGVQSALRDRFWQGAAGPVQGFLVLNGDPEHPGSPTRSMFRLSAASALTYWTGGGCRSLHRLGMSFGPGRVVSGT